MIVLWGARRGDVQYGSRDFWRRNLRIGLPVLEVDRQVFEPGDLIRVADRDAIRRVDSIEGLKIAFVEQSYMEMVARG